LFYEVKQIVFMGGIVEPLLINGREMAELNFASDPEAALYALHAGEPPPTAGGGTAETDWSPSAVSEQNRCDITVINGNLCLQALLTREHFNAFVEQSDSKNAKGIAAYLDDKLQPWFSWIGRMYNLPGFHAWDATAALYLTDPQLFEPQKVLLRSSLEDLSRGFLRFEETNGTQTKGYRMDGKHNSRCIEIPSKINDLPAYWRTLFEAWRRAGSSSPA
jgi:inosine-uridine nucleoside N-ribohydrolase